VGFDLFLYLNLLGVPFLLEEFGAKAAEGLGIV
jgi:hypothetical protein